MSDSTDQQPTSTRSANKYKGLLRFTSGALLVLLVAGFGLGYLSRRTDAIVGLQNGAFPDGPDSPNWVSSDTSAEHPQHVAPIAITGPPEEAWNAFLQAVEKSGGVIISGNDDYLHATYASACFRFVDDLEARLDRDAGSIAIRSASRIGHSDFNANRKRVKRLREQLAAEK